MEQETRIAVVGIIVENKRLWGRSTRSFTITAPILSEEWEFHIGKKVSILSVLLLMHRRM